MKKRYWLITGISCFMAITAASAGEFRHPFNENTSNMTAYEMYNRSSIHDSNDNDPWTLYMGVALGGFGLKVHSSTGLTQSNIVPGGTIHIGLHVNKYLSTELRFGLTSQGKTSYTSIRSGATTITGVPLSVSHKVDSFITYLVKPTLPAVSDNLDVYVALGGTTAQVTVADSFGTSVSKSKSGFSFGAGANWYLSDSVRLETELINYWSNLAFSGTIKSSMWGATSSINMAF